MDTTQRQARHPVHALRQKESLVPFEQPKDKAEVKQLATKQGSNAARRGPSGYHSPIHRLPVEILSKIHENCVENRLLPLGTLLLVSKSWYAATISNSRLWQCIDIRFSSPNHEELHRLQSYVNDCLVYSRNLSLRIEIDFSNWQEETEWSRSTFYRIIKDINRSKLSDKDRWASVPTKFLEETEGKYKKFDEGCRALIQSIIGSEKLESTRWEGLKLIFPDQRDPPQFLIQVLQADMPNLRQISIHNLNGYRIELDLLILPVFPSLQELKLTNSSLRVEEFCLDYTRLTGLQVNERSISLTTLNTCMRLQKLDLYSDESYSRHILGKREETLFLPDLQYLGLGGRIKGPYIKMHLPALDHVTLRMTDSLFVYKFPKLKPKYVQWTIEPACRSEWDEYDLKKAAVAILTQFETMCSLEVDEFAREETLIALKEAQAEGQCLFMVVVS